LAEHGELFDFVARTGKFSEPLARHLFQQILQALFACYQKGIAHRDLKPENLLIGNGYKLLLADFGFSSLLSKHKNKKGMLGKLNTYLGTEAYMAPEIHLRLDYNGTSVDLFAAAIILFVMVSGAPPFEEAKPSDNFYKWLCTNKYSEFWDTHKSTCNYSNEFIDLMNAMLAFDPT